MFRLISCVLTKKFCMNSMPKICAASSSQQCKEDIRTNPSNHQFSRATTKSPEQSKVFLDKYNPSETFISFIHEESRSAAMSSFPQTQICNCLTFVFHFGQNLQVFRPFWVTIALQIRMNETFPPKFCHFCDFNCLLRFHWIK